LTNIMQILMTDLQLLHERRLQRAVAAGQRRRRAVRRVAVLRSRRAQSVHDALWVLQAGSLTDCEGHESCVWGICAVTVRMRSSDSLAKTTRLEADRLKQTQQSWLLLAAFVCTDIQDAVGKHLQT